MRIVGFEPCFSVLDVELAKAHYESLGFSTSDHDETYAFAHLDELTIHLCLAEDPSEHAVSTLYLHVDDADALATMWRDAGQSVIGPDDYDYGKREGTHVDPDGNVIRFGSPIAS